MPKSTLVPQQGEPDPSVRDLIKGKLSKNWARGYVQPGYVRALTSFFSVPKGQDDIRLVYNGTKSGLNDCLWAPWFCLPTIDQLLRSVMPGTYMADIDIGELLLNFVMHKCMQPYAGVDFTLYFPKEWANGWKLTLWERWVYKLRTLDGHIAPDFFVYVDDVHSTGFDSDVCP